MLIYGRRKKKDEYIPIMWCLIANLLQEEDHLHGVVDCVNAQAVNAPPPPSLQVNPGVQNMPDFVHAHFPSPRAFILVPAVGLDLARDLDSPGPRSSHHDPASENRPNHSTASAGSVLTQSPGEEL